jgi:trypsin
VLVALLFALLVPQNASAITNADKVSVMPDEVPWMVSLWRTDSHLDRLANGYACGGALIDAYTVITAAHCMDSLSDTNFSVVLGQRYASSRGTVAQARTVTYYPRYRIGSYLFDLAIIDLYEPITIAKYLRVATNQEVTYLLRKPSVLYGWGENERKKLPTMLRRAVQFDMSKIAKQYFGDFTFRTQFAAGRLNANRSFTGACNLDSGSPLVGTVNGKQVLMGIASYGSLKSCTTKTPRVFTRTSWFGPWIAKIQALNTQARATSAVDYSTALYFGSGLNQLPVTTGIWADERGFISQRAVFGTEGAAAGVGDLQSLDAYALAPSQSGDDFVLDVTSRTNWSGGVCAWRDLANVNAAPALTLSIRASEGARLATALKISYTANSVDCFAPEGNPMTVTGINGQSAPEACRPRLQMTEAGQLRLVLQASCFRSLPKAMLRLQLRTETTNEVEPGVDAWAGPFNLQYPASAQ